MRVLVAVKANKDSEAGVMPSHEMLTEMGAFNQKLVDAGIMLAGEGLQPTSKAKRINFDGGKPKVIDGPFAESKEIIAGFWIWKVASMEEAVEWLMKAPFPAGEVDIRPIFEFEDFGEEFTPELREAEKRQWERAAELNKKDELARRKKD
jgi:hypothetical protein